ncbi:melanoma-associated antigen B2-like [Nycticebus coucang]|uniref:melanoma-associated antigen B2-like n=1 Tax=Nycticebus coucang TaxID=9470 RepID=UPI00234D7335|nr:melanoma-associated antigen B2-like [Nycticebus coucang]
MPRGQKSKLRAREKRQQTRAQNQAVSLPQATAEKEEEFPPFLPAFPCSSLFAGENRQQTRAPKQTVSLPRAIAEKEEEFPPLPPAFHCISIFSGDAPGSLDVCMSQGSEEAPGASCPEGAVASSKSDEEAESQDEAAASSSQASAFALRPARDPLTKKAGLLVQFLLEKYKKEEPILKNDMLKVINKRYKDHFPEILRRASERMEVVFGLELKVVDPVNVAYSLVSKLSFSGEEGTSDDNGLPKSGLLMMLLGVIFINGNRATEEQIWDFLNVLGVHAGRRHLIYGEPRKLITKDMVEQNYLEYRQVPNSDPPTYEFLWGPRAYAETTKMKVLEVLAKINDTEPTSFPNLYDEAVRDEEERRGGRRARGLGPVAGAGGRV